MSFESRIEADGRRLLQSPYWTGIAVTLFLTLPTFIVPTVPLWVSMATLVTMGPMVVVACYLLYSWLFDYGDTSTNGNEKRADAETPFDLLKRRYANGEIDEETFERRLERLLETEERAAEVASHEPVDEEMTVRNR
jgi:uncharacterized membrane protein